MNIPKQLFRGCYKKIVCNDDSRVEGSHGVTQSQPERNIAVNNPGYNARFNYADNYISTSKYNVFTFLPKNLFEQFTRLANFYFLALILIQGFIGYAGVDTLPLYTSLMPLTFVLSATAVKDIYDDVHRHISDRTVNNRMSKVLRDGKVVDEKWRMVKVGDIIKLHNNDFVSADLLLLSSSEPFSLCYIETAELDGETNLKVRQALDETAEMGDDLGKLGAFSGEVVCEPPNIDLSKFEGKLEYKGKTLSLNNDRMLLRGCILRNTQWCFGLVIFAGSDTKLMKNSGQPRFKKTKVDELMNILIFNILVFLLATCLMCAVGCGLWEYLIGFKLLSYLPPEVNSTVNGPAKIAGLVFVSYIILLNTLVPISLYVSVEMIRLALSLYINWDIQMYHKETDTPAQARTTTLVEELGQIEYIFSDKTGTLTQNIMTFNRCSIDGISYGLPVDDAGNYIESTSVAYKVDLSWNPYREENFAFYDARLVKLIQSGDEKASLFFTLLALCHTVMSESKEDGGLEYQAQSPDEGALVGAARNFGFVYKSRTPKTITISIKGQEYTYDLLCILDFNNVRKRMSVIVQRDNKITLFSKGADTIMLGLLSPESAHVQRVTTDHLDAFAETGLRTLVLAYKHINVDYYNEWSRRHHEASVALTDREAKLDLIYEEIEKNMLLLGATAVEDKLQDGVPQTIANLVAAGIKFWVLTGDKQETAINIGYSCCVLKDSQREPFIIDGCTCDQVNIQITEALAIIDKDSALFKQKYGENEETKSCMHERYALVINGCSLVWALKSDMKFRFLQLACSCQAVICCRVTPLQKAMVVDLVKTHKKVITLAIGDGANDVSMIKMAHIGIGISGQEGMQAVLASDYAIAQFKYMERLLLVHGRYSYRRLSKFLKYFFYKNFVFTLCNFWFAFFCGFSANPIFDPLFISSYNMAFSAWPVMAVGIFDQDVDAKACIQYPKLYEPGLKNKLFNKRKFYYSLIEAVISSLFLFFIPYATFDEATSPDGIDASDYQSFGTVVAGILVVVVNVRIAVDTLYWTTYSHFFILLTLVQYFGCTLLFYASIDFFFNFTVYVGVGVAVFSMPQFWLCMALTTVILIIPVIAKRHYECDCTSNLRDHIRKKQIIMHYELEKHGVKHFKSGRRSRSISRRPSLKSGYAFAHQSGYGDLITRGIISSDRSTPVISSKMVRTLSSKSSSSYHQDFDEKSSQGLASGLKSKLTGAKK